MLENDQTQTISDKEEPDFFEIVNKYFTLILVRLLNKLTNKHYLMISKPSRGNTYSYHISENINKNQ